MTSSDNHVALNDTATDVTFDVNGNIRLLRDPKEPPTFVGRKKLATDPTRSHIAFAFSGGGIRSAAQCAGVLDAARQDEQKEGRIPEENIKIVSCVSGGGYVGSALMDHQAFHFSQQNQNASFDWDGFFKKIRENHGCVFVLQFSPARVKLAFHPTGTCASVNMSSKMMVTSGPVRTLAKRFWMFVCLLAFPLRGS
jgi:predicted acylesterase/phospholipase RssA